MERAEINSICESLGRFLRDGVITREHDYNFVALTHGLKEKKLDFALLVLDKETGRASSSSTLSSATVHELAGFLDREAPDVGSDAGFHVMHRDAAGHVFDPTDWTVGEDGRFNTSEPFQAAVAAVKRMLDDHRCGDSTAMRAELIVARLTNDHGLVPRRSP